MTTLEYLAEHDAAIMHISDILKAPGETHAEYLRRQVEEYALYPGETARPRRVIYRRHQDDAAPEF